MILKILIAVAAILVVMVVVVARKTPDERSLTAYRQAERGCKFDWCTFVTIEISGSYKTAFLAFD